MKASLFFFSLVFTFLILPTASATTVLPVTLEQLSTRATLIFYGQVISSDVKKDDQSGQIATFTQFEVIDLIKGDSGNTHTIKQIGGYHKESNTRMLIHGVPEFQVGKEYVVFLPEKSSLGFTSPLGLYQGKFSVQTINNERIVNSSRSIAEQPAASRQRSVDIPLAVSAENPARSRLDDFINTVRAYNTH